MINKLKVFVLTGLLLVMFSSVTLAYSTAANYKLTAQFSKAAYESYNTQAQSAVLVQQGWKITRYSNIVKPPGDFWSLDAQYLIAYKLEGTKKRYLFAFRGTEQNAKDWMGSDFDAAPVAFLNTGTTVHKGFLQYASSALNNTYFASVVQAIKADVNSEAIITGHSLGGAAAVLWGAMLVEKGVPLSRITVITFGQPEVGKPNFVSRYSGRLKLTRFVRWGDPVVVSASPLGYRHFGDVIHAPYMINPLAAHSMDNYKSFVFANY